MRWIALTLAALAVTLIVAVLIAVVSGGGSGKDRGDLTTQINLVLKAMRDRDGDFLRDRMSDGLSRTVQDRDVAALVECIPEGAILEFAEAFNFDIQDDSATVTVRYNVIPPGESEMQLDREWEFERQDDGTWALSALPECPFQ